MDSLFIHKNVRKAWLASFIVGLCLFVFGGSAAADCTETFSWLPNTESTIKEYKMYYGETSGGPYPNMVNVGNPAPVNGRIQGSVTGLSCGRQYYFVCVAVNNIGIESDYSPQLSVIPVATVPQSTSDTTPPLSPGSVTGKIQNKDIILSWNANTESDLSGYRVYYGTASRNYGLPIAVGGTSYTITGLASDITYFIGVSAIDKSGNESGYSSPEIVLKVSTPVVIIPDTIAPVVTITSPTTATSFGTGSNSLNIGGTASDAVGVTQVVWSNSRGGSGTATGTTGWSAAGIALGLGENVITVTAADKAGNKSTDTLTVVYTVPDTIAPVVTISSPTSETSFGTGSNSLNIGGTTSDAVGVTQVVWSNSRGGSGTATGTTGWSAAGIVLGVGENVITVTAADKAGNKSTDTLTVVYTVPDTIAPVVTISSPTTATSFGTGSNSLNLGGTASDAVGVTQVVWSNSRGGSGTATGTTAWSAAGIALGLGENVITVTVADKAGNKSTDSLTVVYTQPDTVPPVLKLMTPTTGSSYFSRATSISISGTASDNLGVTKITWSNSNGGSGTATGTSSWSATNIIIKRVVNVITITAEDKSGNKTNYTFTVYKY